MPSETLEDRFWAKVDKLGGEDGCWFWMGSLTSGYGTFYQGAGAQPKNARAHRAAYELLVGPIPKGLHLDHLCRNRSCVNPAHLEPVTSQENTLRGEGHTAQNARKTHCDRGHEFTAENTYEPPGRPGQRVCRACAEAWREGWRWKQETPTSEDGTDWRERKRWVTPAGTCWHFSRSCANRKGDWVPYLIEESRNPEYYRPCGMCASVPDVEKGGGG